MSEETKKSLNTSLTANVQGTNKQFISSDYIIKSHKLLEQGFKVYLLAQGTNTPYKGSRGHLDATDDVYRLIDLFNQYGANSNIGISLADTGIAVLDIDKHSTNGFQSLIQSGHTLNLDEQTWEMTPRSGAHVFFKIPDGVKADDLKHDLMAGVELLTDKATISPSVKLVDGKEVAYRHFGGNITNCSVMPDWLVKLASNTPTNVHQGNRRLPKYSIQQRWQMVLDGFTEGERNNQAVSLAGYLLRIDVDPNISLSIVQKVNGESAIPLPDREIEAIFNSAYKREVKRARMGGR